MYAYVCSFNQHSLDATLHVNDRPGHEVVSNVFHSIFRIGVNEDMKL